MCQLRYRLVSHLKQKEYLLNLFKNKIECLVTSNQKKQEYE